MKMTSLDHAEKGEENDPGYTDVTAKCVGGPMGRGINRHHQ